MTTGFKLTEQAARRTAKTVGVVLGSLPGGQRGARIGRTLSDTRYQGVLTSNLPAADSGWTGPTTATMRVYLPDPESSADPVEFIAALNSEGDPLEITLVNRDESLEADEGAYVKAEMVNGEWSPYWVGFP